MSETQEYREEAEDLQYELNALSIRYEDLVKKYNILRQELCNATVISVGTITDMTDYPAIQYTHHHRKLWWLDGCSDSEEDSE